MTDQAAPKDDETKVYKIDLGDPKSIREHAPVLERFIHDQGQRMAALMTEDALERKADVDRLEEELSAFLSDQKVAISVSTTGLISMLAQAVVAPVDGLPDTLEVSIRSAAVMHMLKHAISTYYAEDVQRAHEDMRRAAAAPKN